MRIGIDFDNTIICYDKVFRDLAKTWNLIDDSYQGDKNDLRKTIHLSPEGELIWQKLQGKVYGEFIQNAEIFPGVKEFMLACSKAKTTIFIVSHKTEFGHFDEKRINLRDVSKEWLRAQGLFEWIPEEHVFFEKTRYQKIKRIEALQCTHFIDDLIEIFHSPFFPSNIKQMLFRPSSKDDRLNCYSNWHEIKNELFIN